jgi:hypothetical protein
MKRLLSLALTAILATACSKDSTGPSINLSGNWSYSTSNIASGSVTCSSSGTTMSITQSGNTFSGTYNGGTLTCQTPGGTGSDVIGSGIVATGSLSGSNVNFDLDTSDWHNTGALSGNSMSGTVTVHLVIGGTTYVLAGNWAAARL